MPGVGRRRGAPLGILLLLFEVFGIVGINRVPPITLCVTVFMSTVYLRLFKLPWTSPYDVCISVRHVWFRKEWWRIFYGTVEHTDDMHLYFNMISFIWKGINLEKRLGSLKFLYVIIVFTTLTGGCLVALSGVASELLDAHFLDQCAVGFSGVIFALKVVTTYYWPSTQNTFLGMHLPLSPQYFVWAELLLIQLFVPEASFLGHLAGILVGLSYVKGPLKTMMDAFSSIFAGFPTFRSRPDRSQTREYTRPGAYSQRYEQFIPPGMSEEEQMDEAVRASLFDHNIPSNRNSQSQPSHDAYQETSDSSFSTPSSGLYPNLERLRRRRLLRFS
ncbi:rhomboid-related protein 4-like [Limulus polyphemus]|uniref:Rhomboid-related protein 4-like n=1 Tax=Limulus polyphemus TaxID=6850 RepID=A0ABM1BU06_LIMPO|nr:rhomboid-related protein 4-like [Limulus polyphemus]